MKVLSAARYRVVSVGRRRVFRIRSDSELPDAHSERHLRFPLRSNGGADITIIAQLSRLEKRRDRKSENKDAGVVQQVAVAMLGLQGSRLKWLQVEEELKEDRERGTRS